MAATGPVDKTQTLNLAPTMLIGLGGTGKEVLLRIRRLFYERGGKQDNTIGYPIIGYLVMDTDGGSFSRLEGENLSHFVLKNIQFKQGDRREAIDCSVKPNEFAQYFDGDRRLYPHIFSWLLPDMNRFGPTAITEGAGQNRPFGRLAFFHHYPEIKQAMQAHLKGILDWAKDPNLLARWKPDNAIVDPDRLEVVVVYSLAGGTGAGMFLDVGLLVRQVVKELNLPSVRPHFTHIALLPEPFVQQPRPEQMSVVVHEGLQKKIQENAFTALREMEYLSMRQSEARFDLSVPPPARSRAGEGVRSLYRVRWERNASELPITEAPWDTCYLLGGRNGAMGPRCLPPAEIYQMIAEQIFLDFDPSEFGIQKRSLRSNLHEQTLASMKDAVYDENSDELYHRYLSRRFSTFGLSQIYFDRERMRRAASYRLAWRLIREWWLRPVEASASELLKMARDDLHGGVGGNPLVVTNTQLPGDRALPLTYDHVCRQICLIEAGVNETWWDQALEESLRLEQQVEDGVSDPMAGESIIAEWQDKHELRLKKTAAKAGEAGLALRNFAGQRVRLEPEIEDRLRCLFLYRLETLGVPGCLQVFKEYTTLNQTQIKVTDELKASTPGLSSDWRQRLREAQKLPLGYARRAARWELLRSVRVVCEYLAQRYEHAAAGQIEAAQALVRQRVSDASTEGSYADGLRRFLNTLETSARGGVLHYLHERFEELRTENPNQTRTIGLLARYDEADYDRQIHRLIAPDSPPDAALNWPEIERRVLEQIRNAPVGDKKWKEVKSLGDLVLVLFNLKTPQELSQAATEDFARLLAEGCEALLGKFASETSALKQFEIEKAEQQGYRLMKLRVYSAPYLARNHAVSAATLLDTAPIIYLGIAESSSPDEANRFLLGLQEAGNRDQDKLHTVKKFQMKDDALVLYQEKAGIPICYDSTLVSLGELFDHSDRKKETFLDYPNLKDRLPEIRLVDQNKQRLLAYCLENTLLGIMTGVLRYEPNNQKFRLAMRQGGGTALTFSVGSRLEEVTNHCAENETVRNELVTQVVAWFDKATARNGDKGAVPSGETLGLLWGAIQQMHEEIRRRVQFLIDQEKGSIKPTTEAHPLLSILAKRMEPFVHEKLSRLPGGSQWVNSALNWKKILGEIDTQDPVAVDRAWDAWKDLFEGCFKVISEEELPIPVLIPNAQLKPEVRDQVLNDNIPSAHPDDARSIRK